MGFSLKALIILRFYARARATLEHPKFRVITGNSKNYRQKL